MPLTAVLSISSEVLSVIYFTYRYRYLHTSSVSVTPFLTRIRNVTVDFASPFVEIRCLERLVDVVSETADNEFTELLPPVS
jgi:hypothetical protein